MGENTNTGGWIVLAALLVALGGLRVAAAAAAAEASNGHGVDIFRERVRVTSANLPSITLSIRTSAASYTFAHRAADQYLLWRRNEVIVHASEEPADPASEFSAEKRAFEAMARGEYDAAFIPRTMTAQELEDNPDLVVFPLWATGFGPVYNLPEVSDSLVLTQFALAQIYAGVVTMWDDPILQASNTFKLPAKPIELVLNTEAKTFLEQFINALHLADPTFPVVPSYKPVWPTHLYAKYSLQLGVDGPPSYVVGHPYSLTIALVGVSTKLGGHVAAVVNNAGYVVQPNFISINAAMREKAVTSTRAPGSTSISYQWTGDLVAAPGKSSWPFTQATSLLLPRVYARQGCRARSELAKFIRWMVRSDSIRYALARAESVTMLSEEMDTLLGLRQYLTQEQVCEQSDNRVNNGAFEPIQVGGPALLDTHVNLRLQQLQEFSEKESVTTYVSVVMDEDTALTNVANPHTRPDLAWIMPQTFDHMWPGKLQTHLDKVTLVHMNIAGIVPSFKLPDEVEALQAEAPDGLPLKLSMEVLASIFLGDIATWTDPRIVAENPALADSFAAASADATITLVFFGQGSMDDAATTAVSNHLILALNTTVAFQQSGIHWTLPADWSPVAAKLTTLGRPFVWVNIESDLESAVNRIPGAIGYHLCFDNLPHPADEFDLLMPIAFNPHDPSELTIVQVTPSPQAFLACGIAATVSEDAHFLIDATISVDPIYKDCWPIPMLLSLALPDDVQADADASGITSVDLNQLCFRQNHVTEFAAWLSSDEAVISPAKLVGRATLSEIPKWRVGVLAQLDKVNCGGQPIRWTPDIVWVLSSNVFRFGLAATAIGLFAVLGTTGALIHYRHRTIIRSANIPLQLTVLVGLAMLFATPLLFVSEPTMELCSAFAWLLCLGVCLSFAPVCMKIYKVHRSYQQRRNLKVRHMRSKHMYLAVAAMVVFDLCILAPAQSNGGLMQPATIRAMEKERMHTHFQCGVPSEMMGQAVALISVKMAVLLVSCVQAFGVRSVSSAFNESANLSWAVWSSVLSALIIVPLLFLSGGANSNVGVFLLVFLILWVAGGTLVFAFGHKFFTLLAEDRAMRISMRSSKSGSLAHGSSSATRSRETGSSTFNLPSLDVCDLSTLEKYICKLELQIQAARERRRKEFGSASSVGSAEQQSLLGTSKSHASPPVSPPKLRAPKDEANKRSSVHPASGSSLGARHLPLTSSMTASPVHASSGGPSPLNQYSLSASAPPTAPHSPATPAGIGLGVPFVPVVEFLLPSAPLSSGVVTSNGMPPRASSPVQQQQQQRATSPVQLYQRSPSPTHQLSVPRQPLRLSGSRPSLRSTSPSQRSSSPLTNRVPAMPAIEGAVHIAGSHAPRRSSRVPAPGTSPQLHAARPDSPQGMGAMEQLAPLADSPH